MRKDSNNLEKEEEKGGVDGDYYGNEVYKYYLDKDDGDSYDKGGGKIECVVEYDKDQNNGGWRGEYMIQGDGDGESLKGL